MRQGIMYYSLFYFLSFVLLSACASRFTREEEEVIEAFNQWMAQIRLGNIKGALDLSSDLMKARWLYRIYENVPFSSFAKSRYKSLPKDLIKPFDDWIKKANKTYLISKSLPKLPAELSKSAWFLETIKEHYELGREVILEEFRGMTILETAVEFNEATLIVRGGNGITQIYTLKKENGVWKVDWNKPAYR